MHKVKFPRLAHYIIASPDKFIFWALPALVLMFLLLPGQSRAYSPEAMVSFTFDDGAKSIYNNAAPIFAEFGIPAVLYAETGPLNSGEDWVMTWQQVRNLQNTYGWEIGSHTINHLYSTKLSNLELENELAQSKIDLINQGLNVTTFATPYGDHDSRVIAAAARHYSAHRGAWGGPNIWPHNQYALVSLEGKHTTPPAQVKGWIDETINNNQWLILLFHEIVPGVPQEYQYNSDDLREIVAYAASKPIKKVTVAEGINILKANQNLMINGGFETLEGGWAKSWSRSSSAQVSIDTSSRGAFLGGAKTSVKITGSGSQNEAVSPEIALDGSDEYVLSMFHNASNLSSGGFAVWVNEYDGNMKWLGGQWLGGTYQTFIGNKHYTYRPSLGAKNVKVHIFTEARSSLTLYTDAVELRAVGSILSPPQTKTNIIQNGSFEAPGDDGFANNWSRNNNTAITIDGSSMGYPPQPVRSLKIIGGPDQHTAISSLTTILGVASYSISYYQKISLFQSGGAAMWINEFDSNGVWLSGQWLGGTYEGHEGVVTRSYTPTLSNIARIELHLFTEAGSDLTLFIDEVQMVRQ